VLVALALPIFPRIGVMGLVLLFPLITRFIPRAGPGLTASTALFLMAVVAGFMHSRPPLPRMRVLAPLLAFYALSLIGYAILMTSSDLAKNDTIALEAFQALKARVWPTLLLFAGFALAPTRPLRQRLLTCLVIGLLIHDLSGVYDFSTGGAGRTDLKPSALLIPEDYRPSGILDSNPNILGGHLAAFSILALMGMLRRDADRVERTLCAVAYAISGLVLVLTQSRGAWVAFLVGHGIWLFFANRKLLVPAAAAFVVVASAAYSYSLLPKRLSERIEQTLTPGQTLYARQGLAGHFDSSVNARLAIHATAFEIFGESPVWGHGFGSFTRLAGEHGAKHGLWAMGGVPSESVFLTIVVEAGFLGLLVYGWLIWALISPGLALIRDSEERPLGIAFVSIAASILSVSFTQVGLFLPEISMGFWFIAGMVVRAHEQSRGAT
jgi:O-antigen ligase